MRKSQDASFYIRALVCGYAKEIRLSRLMLMLQGYADDSGSDGLRAPYILAGFVLPVEKWAAFSDDWDKALRRDPSVQYFKMAEAAARDGQFEGMQEEFVLNKIHEFLSVIETHQPDGLYSWLSWKNFRYYLDDHIPEGMANPYQLLFPSIFDVLLFYQKRKGIFPEPTDFDFDEQGEAGRFAQMLYPRVKANAEPGVRQMLGRIPLMLDDKNVLPLQAADMLAWTIRREFDPEDKEKRWHWLYEKLDAHVWYGAEFAKRSFGALRRMVTDWNEDGKPRSQNPNPAP